MPSVYAHERFGQQVLEQLSGATREIAEKYRIQFGIGLQGPDFLFFYKAWKSNPIAKLGLEIHNAPAVELFSGFRETLRKRKKDSMETACVLGTICHFMLDSSCHGYVERQVSRTGESHNVIETELERFLMERDGLDPLRFPIWKMIPTDADTAGCLTRLYRNELVNAPVVEKCLRDMRLVKKTLAASTPAGQMLLRSLMRLTGHYDEIQGHLMPLEPKAELVDTSRRLSELSDGAVSETAALLREYFETIETEAALHVRFDRNFE